MSKVTLDADTETWIRAAFSSSYSKEVYIFMGTEYVLINYYDQKIIEGRESIGDRFSSLAGTFFAETGIDCAFRSTHDDGDGNVHKAFIFCGSFCALWDFAPKTKKGDKLDKIVKGPLTIGQMFPGFKGDFKGKEFGKDFENGIDAAFESSETDEAYLFKGKRYARINYITGEVFYIVDITKGFGCLKDTTFKYGIGAAFASLPTINEAYLFKGNSYARIDFAPGSSSGEIKVPLTDIIPTWAALKDILPLNDVDQGHGAAPKLGAPPLGPQATLDEL